MSTEDRNLDPIEETTEETTTETHVEGDTVEVTTAPDGTRTITAKDDPEKPEKPDDPEAGFPR